MTTFNIFKFDPVKERLTIEEKKVFQIIARATLSGRKIQQRVISRELYGQDQERTEDSNMRRVRAIVRRLRIEKGVPILACDSGYYILRSEKEAKEYMKRIEKRTKAMIKSYQKTYSTLRKLLREDNQISIFEKLGLGL